MELRFNSSRHVNKLRHVATKARCSVSVKVRYIIQSLFIPAVIIYKTRFFPIAIINWNQLREYQVAVKEPDAFRLESRK
jgi:hypothetical protein